MNDQDVSDVGKAIIDVLIANERLQLALKCNKSDISDAIYLLYSSTLKLIGKVVHVESRQNRMFRLKYHHILSNESVEEYLYHCLSKILSEVLDEENSYQRFIQPVAELHMKLMSIVNQVHQQHYDIVSKSNKVRKELEKNKHSIKAFSKTDNTEPTSNNEVRFLPVYYVPNHQSCGKIRKSQFLTFQAINKYYSNNEVDALMHDMLLDFDNSFADFELNFVCQVNKGSIISKESAEKTMDVAVMFVDAVKWAHRKGMLQYSSICDCDIEMMVGIPRLSVLYGCGVSKHGPLSEWSLLSCRNKDKAQQRLAPVFQNHFKELARLRRQLNVLNGLEMAYLSRLLLDHDDLPTDAVTSSALSHLKMEDRRHLVSGDVHALFKLISSVSDQMQSEHASDYRFFMETVYKLYKDANDDPVDEANDHLSCPSPRLFIKSQSVSEFSLESGVTQSLWDIEEAVDALAYGVTEQQYPVTNDHSKSMWDIKSYQSAAVSSEKRLPPVDCTISSVPGYITDLSTQLNRPEWQHDSSCTKCCHCGTSFNLFRRRHHCRRCGYLFCNSCWGKKISLPSLGIQSQVAVCVECEEFMEGSRGRAAMSSSLQHA